MSETIEGGAYLSADKKTWHDAEGKVIPAPATQELEVAAKKEDPIVEPEATVITAAPEVVVADKNKGSKKADGKKEA